MSIFQSNWRRNPDDRRSEEHTSELQSHLNSYAVFCLRSEEHTSELQSHLNLVCRLLLEKKKKKKETNTRIKKYLHYAVVMLTSVTTVVEPDTHKYASMT